VDRKRCQIIFLTCIDNVKKIIIRLSDSVVISAWDQKRMFLTTFTIVQSVVALPSFAGLLSKADKGRLDNLFRKALRIGVCSQSFTIDDLISAGDKNYFAE